MRPARVAAGAALALPVAGAVFLAWKSTGTRSAEACATCHADVTGIGGSHEHIGCAACHGGDRRAVDAARSCGSCHSDPVALGCGRGSLRYDSATGRWRFTPQAARSPHDGLPADAWVGFLQPRAGMVSARDDARPLTVEEQ